MLEVLLINPPQIFSRYQVAAGIVPPMGIAYLASFLRHHGVNVQIIDSIGESPKQIVKFKRENIFLRGLTFDQIVNSISQETSLIGISNLFTFNYPAVEELTVIIKKKFPQIPIVLGGPHVSASVEEVLHNPCVDYVISGEGELTLYELCQYIEGKQIAINTISNLSYKNRDEIIIGNGKKSYPDVDSLPFPARDLLPMENYFRCKESHGFSNAKWTSIFSSRGCPYGCTFCESRKGQFRPRAVNLIIDEIESCMNNYGITEFHFEDDNMTLNKNHISTLCEEITKRELNITWQTPNGIRASSVTKDILLAMKKSGCQHITLAPESGSYRVLNEIIRKGSDFDLNYLLQVGKWAHEIGLRVAAFIMVGLPGERKEDIKETIGFVKKMAKAGIDEVAIGLFIPLPGTPLWDELAETRKNIDYLDLLSVGDISSTKSWSDYISGDELKRYRLKAYLYFHFYRLIFHPKEVIHSFINILKGVQENKTERVLLSFFERMFKSF